MPSAERSARGHDAGKAVEKYGWSMVNADHWVERLADDDFRVLSITVNTPQSGRDDYLVVVRVEAGTNRLVAFVGGSTLHDALSSAFNKLGNGTLKLQEDKYATGSGKRT
jgi:hypothetical protein